MKAYTREDIAQNEIEQTAAEFVHQYNESIPSTFPHISVRILQKFQAAYPSLFQQSNMWTVEKHRKKVMDWLASSQSMSM